MQSAYLRNGEDSAAFGRFDLALYGRVLLERQVRSCVMIVVEVSSKNSQQVPFIENDELIEALATNRSDESLDVRRLPWRAVRDHDLLDTHVLDALSEELTVDRIPIPDQEPGRLILGKRLDDLLSRPLGCRMRRDVEVNNHAAMMTEHDEGEEYAELRCRDGEEVDGHDVTNMIVEESTPSLRWRLAVADSVPVHR